MKVLVIRAFATPEKRYQIGKEYEMTEKEYQEFKFFLEKKSEDKAIEKTKPIAKDKKIVKGNKNENKWSDNWIH